MLYALGKALLQQPDCSMLFIVLKSSASQNRPDNMCVCVFLYTGIESSFCGKVLKILKQTCDSEWNKEMR